MEEKVKNQNLKKLNIDLDNLGAVTHDIFGFEVDSRQLRDPGSAKKQRRLFWAKLYQKRQREDSIFNHFLNSDPPLLIVTGHVGTGKSTFVRHKFEKTRVVSGLILDMRGKDENFSKTNKASDVQKGVNNVVAKAYKNSLLNNIKYKIISNFDTYHNYDFEIGDAFSVVSNGDWNSIHYDEKTRQILALEALFNLRTSSSLEHIIDTIPFRVDNSDDERLRKLILDNLKTPKDIHNVLNSMNWEDYITLHRTLFPSELPSLLVFDNIDVLPLKKLKDTFLDSVISLINQINNINEYPYSLFGPRPLKIAITVRDENISRFRIEGAAAMHIYQMTMSPQNYNIPDVKQIKSFTLDYKLVLDILDARLGVLDDENLNENLVKIYKCLLRKLWINPKENTIRKEIGSLNIQQLCNESIRLILEHADESTREIIKNYIQGSEEMINLNPLCGGYSYQLLTGQVISSLWSHSSTKSVMNTFSDEIHREIDSEYFGLHYLILTYLWNKQKQKEKAIVLNLYKSFDYAFGIDAKVVQKALFALTSSNFRQGEMLTVYQDKLIRKPNHIKENSILELNGKGELFMTKIIIHIDFYGQITNETHQIRYKTLTELSPDKASKYINTIYEFLEKLYHARVKSWTYGIVPRLIGDPAGKPFFDYFSDNFAYENVFHLKRVSDSHRNSIKLFLADLIWGKNIRSWLSKKEIEYVDGLVGDLDEKRVSNVGKVKLPSDIILHELLSDLPEKNDFKKIWITYQKYERLGRDLNSLRNKSRNELKVSGRISNE